MSDKPKPAETPTKARSLRRWLYRGVGVFLGCVVFYVAFVLLGYVPVNGGYQPPPAADRVVIFVRSNDIHTDLVLPVNEPDMNCDWRTVFPAEHFQDDVRGAKYVAIGWGDKGFFMDTPQWKDLKVSTLINALFLPSESVLHVDFPPAVAEDAWTREVHLSRAQYQTLIDHVRATIKTDGADTEPLSAGDFTYGRRDHFFRARGSYHLFNTCNQWTGRGLKRAGVPTGLWTPLKEQVMGPLPPVTRE